LFLDPPGRGQPRAATAVATQDGTAVLVELLHAGDLLIHLAQLHLDPFLSRSVRSTSGAASAHRPQGATDAGRLPHRDPRHRQRWERGEADDVLQLGAERRVHVRQQHRRGQQVRAPLDSPQLARRRRRDHAALLGLRGAVVLRRGGRWSGGIRPHAWGPAGRICEVFVESAGEQVQGTGKAESLLVSDASHELRTPLTSVRTNIDLLRQGVTLSDRDRDRLLRDVTRELEELTTLVANIVELARGSQRDLHLEHARLDDLAERVVQRAQARFPSLEFALEADATTVWGDPEELERALWNLVENAAKWSNGGGRVDLTIVGGEVTVRDHGPGVPETDRPFIFDRFYRSEAARGQPGSGLGLAIVRQIAESHGGRVEVENAEGGGARFRLVLLRS
jgi:signal transduction histidine kinase